MIDISIVIPVYNVENYIDRCLDSIFYQKFTGKFEVIVVNDASTDNSLNKLKEYKKKQPLLKIIEKPINEKVSMAYANGIAAAKGIYIMRIDSDDWIVENSLETLLSEIKKTSADVILFNYFEIFSTGKIRYKNLIKNNLSTNNKDAVAKHFSGGVNKLIRRELTTGIVLERYSFNSGDDLIFFAEIFCRAQTFSLIQQPLYAYFQNPISITHSIDNKTLLNSRLFLLKLLAEISTNNNGFEPSFNDLIDKKFKRELYIIIFNTWIVNFKFNYNKRKILSALKQYEGINQLTIINIEKSINNFLYSFYFMIKEYGFKSTLVTIIKMI